MVSRASTKLEENGDGRGWPAATMADFVRDGMYVRFKEACGSNGVKLRKSLKLIVEAGRVVVKEGVLTERAIATKLSDRSASLPKDMGVSYHTLSRSRKYIWRVLGVEVFAQEPFTNRLSGFTQEGRILWEEAGLWARLGLLENSDFVDFPSVLRLAQKRRSEQNGGGDEDIQGR